jgi:molybdopterin molybdotransferase
MRPKSSPISSSKDSSKIRIGKKAIMENNPETSFQEAYQKTLEHIHPLPAEDVRLECLIDRIAAEDLFAHVDSPSVDISLKDGYAVLSEDVATATPEHPITLRIIGTASAGHPWEGMLLPGAAVDILSGARIPAGAQAVVSQEFTQRHGDEVFIMADAAPGRNILLKGGDIAQGQRIIEAGMLLQPAQVGLLAASGYVSAKAIQQPRIAIIATGDEVIAPGMPLREGALFASNLVTLAAWCTHYGMKTSTRVIGDDREQLRRALLNNFQEHDALLTSGGAWNSDRDFVVHILDGLGWAKVYHRVRLGPGKAVAFGLCEGKPVFCLPGGPPSNQMAFLQLALPGLMNLAGHRKRGLPTGFAQLTTEVRGQIDWTQFIHGRLEASECGKLFHPLRLPSRLQMMAGAEALLQIPEGVDRIAEGTIVQIQILQ